MKLVSMQILKKKQTKTKMMIDFITYILIASTFFYLGVEFGKNN